MEEVSKLRFPELDKELEICDEKMRSDFEGHKTYFYHSLNGRTYVISDERVDITDTTHNAAVPIQAADFMVAASSTTLLGLKSQIYTRVTSGAVSDYIDGLANGNYMLDVRQGVTDLPTTSHLECIVHKLDSNYITVLATDLYGNIFTRRKYTDGWHAWERYARQEGTAVVTLPASGWSQSAPYTQRVAVAGVKAGDDVELKLYAPKNLSAQEAKLRQKQTAMITDGITEDGYVSFYCGAKKPAADFSVLLKGVKVNG